MRQIPVMLVIAACSRAALAQAPVPAVSARARPPVELALSPSRQEPACRTITPESWRDPSNARFFATGPTARLDAQELATGTLAPLVNLRFVAGALHLFLLGSPIRPGLQFTTSGWRPRWPFC